MTVRKAVIFNMHGERVIGITRPYGPAAFILGLVMLLLATCVQAAQVTKVGLMRNHTATRVVMKAGSPFEFQVDLADPQTIIIRLPGSEITAELPKVEGDPLLASLEKRSGAVGAELVVRTKAPGMTVLPFYEAASRTLTLEVGGAASVEVNVPDEAPKAKPAAAPKPAPQKKAGPAPKPEAPKQQAAPLAQAPEGPVPAVAGIRLGTHENYTRLVLDADRILEPTLAMEGKQLVLGLANGMLLPDAKMGTPDKRVRGLSVVKAKPLRVQLTLDRPLGRYKMFPLDDGRKVVLDIALAEPGGKAAQGLPTPEKAFGLAEPKPQAAPKLEAEKPPVRAMTEVTPEELKTTPEMPVAEPQQLAKPGAGSPENPAPMPQAPRPHLRLGRHPLRPPPRRPSGRRNRPPRPLLRLSARRPWPSPKRTSRPLPGARCRPSRRLRPWPGPGANSRLPARQSPSPKRQPGPSRARSRLPHPPRRKARPRCWTS